MTETRWTSRRASRRGPFALVVAVLAALTALGAGSGAGASVSGVGAEKIQVGPTGAFTGANYSAAANNFPEVAVDAIASPDGQGLILAHANGVVEAYGRGVVNYGGASEFPLNGPILGIGLTPTGDGYWLVASDGGIFSFGGAPFLGSMGGTPLNQPVFSMAATPSGDGYWLVARDGGIFSFGDAPFLGSMGGTPLNQAVTGLSTAVDGLGYRMVAADGGIFSFGAEFFGSLGGQGESDIISMALTPSGEGYWMLRGDGRIFHFGDALPMPAVDLRPYRAVAMASNPVEQGLYVITDNPDKGRRFRAYRAAPGLDIPKFDALRAQCAAGDDGYKEACDALWSGSPFVSEYERFGATCGDRRTVDTPPPGLPWPSGSPFCVDDPNL